MEARFSTLMSLIVVVAFGLAACDKTNFETSLFREVSDSDATLVTDAKQRIVFRRKETTETTETTGNDKVTVTKTKSNHIICAEPSPDIAQAFSEVLKIANSLDGSLSDPPDGENSQNTGSIFVNSFAGSIAQLGERLAVIQLFRDRMYRACEAYANGAIDATAYTLMLARNDKTMATLLTAEMAAGAFGRSLARIGSTAEFVGTNSEERAELHRNIIRLTDELKNIAEGGDENRVEMAADTSSELINAYTELLALDLSMARIAASSSITESTLGNIAGRHSASDFADLTGEISNIHQAFLDDPGLEPLIDACLTALARIELTDNQAKEVENELKKIEESSKIIDSIDRKMTDIGRIDITFDKYGISNELDNSFLKGPLSGFSFNTLPVNNNEKFTISKSEYESQISGMQDNRSDNETEIKEAKITIYGVMLAASNPFAAFCTNELLGDLSERGFIKTMLKSRLELRELDDRVKFKHLEVCEKLLSNELQPNQRADVITFCTKT